MAQEGPNTRHLRVQVSGLSKRSFWKTLFLSSYWKKTGGFDENRWKFWYCILPTKAGDIALQTPEIDEYDEKWRVSRREVKGQHFERFSEFFERFSEIFERFLEVLSETLSEAAFPLRGSQSCCPYSCCPLNFLQVSPTQYDCLPKSIVLITPKVPVKLCGCAEYCILASLNVSTEKGTTSHLLWPRESRHPHRKAWREEILPEALQNECATQDSERVGVTAAATSAARRLPPGLQGHPYSRRSFQAQGIPHEGSKFELFWASLLRPF